MELSILGTKVTIPELRQDVLEAKETGTTGQYASSLETVEALLDLIDTLKPSYSFDDIVKLFDEKYQAHLQETASTNTPDDARIDAAKEAALNGLEAQGLARRENTFDWTIWHFVPTNGPSVPKYRVRN